MRELIEKLEGYIESGDVLEGYIESEFKNISKGDAITVRVSGEGGTTKHMTLSKELILALNGKLKGKKGKVGSRTYHQAELDDIGEGGKGAFSVKVVDGSGNKTKWVTLDKKVVDILASFLKK